MAIRPSLPGHHRPPESSSSHLKKIPNKKATPAGGFSGSANLSISHYGLEQKFYLASSYFCRGLPPNYRRRCCVSQPSSRWIGVVPQRHGHQDRNQLKPYGML